MRVMHLMILSQVKTKKNKKRQLALFWEDFGLVCKNGNGKWLKMFLVGSFALSTICFF